MKSFIPIVIVLLSFLWAMPVFRMMHAWLIDKTMDGRLVLFSLAVHATAIFALWNARKFELLLGYLAVTSLLWLAMPAINRVGDAIAMRRMQDSDIRRYTAILEHDPRHAAAMAALADAYIERGLLDEAIALYEQAIAIDPEHTRGETWKLQQAIALRDRRHGRRGAPPITATPDGTNRLVLQEEPAATPETPPPTPPPRADEEPKADDERQQEVWRWFDSIDKT